MPNDLQPTQVCLLQVNLAISTAARSANEGSPGKAVQRKRPRTENGQADNDVLSQHGSKLFIEKSSPVALAKAIKNKVRRQRQSRY